MPSSTDYDCPTCGSALPGVGERCDNVLCLSALAPRVCHCGAPTGSVALDTCEAHDGAPVQSRGDARTRRAIRDMHALAVDSHATAVREHLEGGAE